MKFIEQLHHITTFGCPRPVFYPNDYCDLYLLLILRVIIIYYAPFSFFQYHFIELYVCRFISRSKFFIVYNIISLLSIWILHFSLPVFIFISIHMSFYKVNFIFYIYYQFSDDFKSYIFYSYILILKVCQNDTLYIDEPSVPK